MIRTSPFTSLSTYHKKYILWLDVCTLHLKMCRFHVIYVIWLLKCMSYAITLREKRYIRNWMHKIMVIFKLLIIITWNPYIMRKNGTYMKMHDAFLTNRHVIYRNNTSYTWYSFSIIPLLILRSSPWWPTAIQGRP